MPRSSEVWATIYTLPLRAPASQSTGYVGQPPRHRNGQYLSLSVKSTSIKGALNRASFTNCAQRRGSTTWGDVATQALLVD